VTESEYIQNIQACQERLLDNNENKFFLNMQIAIGYRHLNKYQEALRYTQNAIQDADTKNDFNLCYWNFGIIYKHLGNKTKAMKFYKKCLVYYSQKEDMRRKGDILKNMSRLAVSTAFALEAVETLKLAQKFNEATQENLDDAFDNLYDIYVMQSNYLKAFETIKNIRNDELRQQLQEKLICLQQQVKIQNMERSK